MRNEEPWLMYGWALLCWWYNNVQPYRVVIIVDVVAVLATKNELEKLKLLFNMGSNIVNIGLSFQNFFRKINELFIVFVLCSIALFKPNLKI